MARENQGLQIALIIFVMLTIVLGVTTFIFFRQYEEADAKAATNQTEASQSMAAARAKQEENNEMKRLMGFAATENLENIHEKFAQDMQTYAANFPEENRFYSPVLAYLHTVIKDKNEALTAEQTVVQELKDNNEIREKVKDPQIKKHQEAAAKARQDLTGEREKFDADRARFKEDGSQVAASLQKAREEADVALGKVQTKLEDINKRFVQVDQIRRRVTEERNALVKETFEVAHGEIRWVNQRNKTVWVNLGRADKLGRQTTFAVYSADTSDVTKAGKKANIEITQVLGDHLCEARIIDDRISDPIMPGDKVHTPVWTPGAQKRFALVPFMDIDGDGASDQHIIRSLITMNGGAIDAEVDEKGKQTGKITINTRYLVRGEAPDAKSNQALIDRISKAVGEAQRLGIEQISYRDLLRRMGWKNQSPVITYGDGANPKDFRAQPAEGMPRDSGGNVSGLFRERRPAAPKSGRSAY